MYFKLLRYSILFLVLASACIPRERVDQSALREEMKDREVKAASEGEIMAAAQAQGRFIADASQRALAAELGRAFGESGAAGAIEYCNLKAIPLIDSLSRAYQAQIRRTTLKARNPDNKPTEVEAEILEAYQFSSGQGQTVEDNIQTLDGDEILYTKPIVIGNELCLKCHGVAGKDISQETQDILKRLYPNDEAVGYSMGDLRGMWSIRLSKKQVVRSM